MQTVGKEGEQRDSLVFFVGFFFLVFLLNSRTQDDLLTVQNESSVVRLV